MAPRLHDHPDDLFALVGAASDALGIDPAFVEKDFWVTEVLRGAVATAPPDATLIFKGGTSLSKTDRIIERFSEDIDLLLVMEAGEGVRNRALKSICEGAGAHIGAAPDRKESTKGVKRNVRYGYPRRHGSGAISESVLLELGTRGGPHPHSVRPIRSYIAEYAVDDLGEAPSTWEEFTPVEIAVLNPERTLIEKLSLLNDLATRYQDNSAAQDRLEAAGRHVYDVFRLLGHRHTIRTLRELASANGLVDLAQDVERHSREAGWPFTPRPDEGYAAGPAFDPTHPSQTPLGVGFERVRALVWGAFPTFEECRDRVRAAKDLL